MKETAFVWRFIINESSQTGRIENCVMMCQDEIEKGSRIQKVQEVQGVQLFHGVGIGIKIAIRIVSHLAFDSDSDSNEMSFSAKIN